MEQTAKTLDQPLPTSEYIFVDDIPEVAELRADVRTAAWSILESRKLGSGEDTSLPLPIDALSTAHNVLETANSYGRGSSEHIEAKNGLKLDCQRLVAEWYRKKKPEYFPAVRHTFNAETEEFFSHGLSIRQMTENALRPIQDNREEEARRINERVEDATPQILRNLGKIAVGRDRIRTVSECADTAIAAYTSDIKAGRPHQGYGGYVPEIEKVMLRDIRLDGDSNDRFEEQIGLPGKYITHFVFQQALSRRNLEARHMDKTELHGAQMLVDDDLMDFVELLDTVAGEQWCVNIFMGEVVPADYVKDYAGFRVEALVRQAELKDISDTVASFVLDLAESGMDPRKAPAHVEEFVKKELLELGKHDHAVAEQMFDEKTADGLQQVAKLEANGQHDQALSLMQRVETQAPGGGYCGGGSCGLENVNMFSKEGKEISEKLDVKSGDSVVKDNERSCKCGSKSIFYAYNKNKVNKYCGNCGAFESKKTKS